MESNSSPQKDIGERHPGEPRPEHVGMASVGAMRESRPLSGVRVFLIDDEPGVLKALSMVLQAFGGAVQAFPRAEEALSALKTTHQNSTPHIIVSDLRMPGLSGIELLTSLRAQGVETPFILMSGHATVIDIEEAADAGVDGYVPKPFSPPQLVTEILRLASPREEVDTLP
jgi:two-component system C4-dicarboxylate transport response regulator DctD